MSFVLVVRFIEYCEKGLVILSPCDVTLASALLTALGKETLGSRFCCCFISILLCLSLEKQEMVYLEYRVFHQWSIYLAGVFHICEGKGISSY